MCAHQPASRRPPCNGGATCAQNRHVQSRRVQQCRTLGLQALSSTQARDPSGPCLANSQVLAYSRQQRRLGGACAMRHSRTAMELPMDRPTVRHGASAAQRGSAAELQASTTRQQGRQQQQQQQHAGRLRYPWHGRRLAAAALSSVSPARSAFAARCFACLRAQRLARAPPCWRACRQSTRRQLMRRDALSGPSARRGAVPLRVKGYSRPFTSQAEEEVWSLLIPLSNSVSSCCFANVCAGLAVPCSMHVLQGAHRQPHGERHAQAQAALWCW